MSMVKNIIILLLLVTNGATLFYIYNHMAPERNVTVDTRTEQKPPEYYYRITMKDGGVAEGIGIMKKTDSVDLIGKRKLTTTIANNDIQNIEKVYYSTGKTKKIVTKNTTTKSYN